MGIYFINIVLFLGALAVSIQVAIDEQDRYWVLHVMGWIVAVALQVSVILLRLELK